MYFKNVIYVFIYVPLLLIFSGCWQKESATTKNLSKENSVEIIVSTKHLNEKYDLIRTTRRIYLQNKLIKETSSFDTIPALGRAQVQEEESNKIKSVQKDYDIFVTVQ